MINADLQTKYKTIRENGGGFHRQKRGLIEVSGKEAIQFLNGLITNDAAKLEENAQMSAAFPNAQGRLIAIVRVMRKGDKFLFETEEATREKVFNNLFRFTFAGDFFVEDLSSKYEYFAVQGSRFKVQSSDSIVYQSRFSEDYFVPQESVENFLNELQNQNVIEVSDELYEILRIENGMPLYGVDMDETTIVPEVGLPETINYNKGCYIGQEIIARIHFRGHIAKQLTGLIFSEVGSRESRVESDSVGMADEIKMVEIKSADGKNAGRITSVTFSPMLGKTIALAYVRYDYLAEGTELKIGDLTATVKNIPFVE